ncbi:hypothetical protein GCM10007908_30800 [Rhizobium albus]|nr:hypothetical protein GCM10007908_30800 [Rhizobium albus]
MRNKLDTPLGQARKSRQKRRPWPGRFALGTSAAVVLLLAGSIYSAMSPSGLSGSPAPVATADTPVVAPDETDEYANLQTGTVPARTAGTAGGNIASEMTGDGVMVTTYRPGSREGLGPLIIDGGAVGQDLRVAHLPEDALLEETEFGAIPTISPGGKRSAEAYARSWSGTNGAKIAIVVGGLGLSQTGTQYAIEKLPEEITLAFAASGNSLTRWMQDARRGGHEILLQIPLEPFDYPSVDPGANTLTVEAPLESNIEALHKSLARMTNYTGVMNYMGGRFMSDIEAFEPVMREIADRGLLFLDDGSASQSRSQMLARTFGAPFGQAEIVLDSRRERGAIMEALDALERSAVRNGAAIGVASAFDVSVDAIAEWVRQASRRNIEIVSVSAIALDPASSRAASR